MIKIGSCVFCGKDLGILTPKVSLKNAYVCADCFEAAGFSMDDKKSIEAFSGVLHQDFDKVKEQVLGAGGKPNWNNPDYIIGELRKITSHPNIAMKKDEVCYFQAHGEIGKKKTRTIRKGKKSYKETYFEKTPCEFYMTSDRFIAVVPKGSGFVINHGGVLALSLHKDALEINRNGKAYVVFMRMSDIDRYKKTWMLLDKAKTLGLEREDLIGSNYQKKKEEKKDVEVVFESTIATDYAVVENEDPEESVIENIIPKEEAKPTAAASENAKDNVTADPVTELRKYKALLDDGLINQDEFDVLKKRILGL